MNCPKCGGDARNMWVTGQRLQRQCRDRVECGWEAKPKNPERQLVRTKRLTDTGDGWCFEAFDQYGHTFCYSESFASKAAATAAAKRDIARWSTVDGYRKCTAVVWPPHAVITGTRIR